MAKPGRGRHGSLRDSRGFAVARATPLSDPLISRGIAPECAGRPVRAPSAAGPFTARAHRFRAFAAVSLALGSLSGAAPAFPGLTTQREFHWTQAPARVDLRSPDGEWGTFEFSTDGRLVCVWFAPEAGGRYLVVGYQFAGRATSRVDQPIELFDTRDWRILLRINDPEISSAVLPQFSPDGRTLALVRGSWLEIGSTEGLLQKP